MIEEDRPPEKTSVLAERRAAERYRCHLPLTWRVHGVGPGETWSAGVRDISTTGIGLAFEEAVRPGEVLILQLRCESQRLSGPMPVRVMHATERPEGGWIIGCRFVRALTQRELQALLEEA